MDAAMVLGLVNPEGGKVKRSDYDLQDNDYVIQPGDNANTVASAMRVNPQTVQDLGEFQTGDVIPGMPGEQPEVTQEEAMRVKPDNVTKDPEILDRMKAIGVPDPSQLSGEDYMMAQMLVFNDILADKADEQGTAFNEEAAIQELAQKHPKQISALFKEFGRIRAAESEALEYEEAKDPSITGRTFNMAADIIGQQPPLGGMNLELTKGLI